MDHRELELLGKKIYREFVIYDLDQLTTRSKNDHRDPIDFREIELALAILWCKVFNIEIPRKERLV